MPSFKNYVDNVKHLYLCISSLVCICYLIQCFRSKSPLGPERVEKLFWPKNKKKKNSKFPKAAREPPGTTGGHRGGIPDPKNAKNQHAKNFKIFTFSKFV